MHTAGPSERLDAYYYRFRLAESQLNKMGSTRALPWVFLRPPVRQGARNLQFPLRPAPPTVFLRHFRAQIAACRAGKIYYERRSAFFVHTELTKVIIWAVSETPCRLRY